MSPSVGDRLLLTLVPPLAASIIRILHFLIRTETIGWKESLELRERGEHPLFIFWHDQLLLMIKGYRGAGIRILISASKDGELIARTMRCFGQGAVRGSSSRGGRAAFRELIELAKEPVDIAITPDGPKGPRHRLKEGVVQLARLSGRPVIPVAFACSRGHRFASWDRFLLPFPFSRGVYSFAPPLRFAAGESAEEFQARVQLAMDENNRRAAARLEESGVSAV